MRGKTLFVITLFLAGARCDQGARTGRVGRDARNGPEDTFVRRVMCLYDTNCWLNLDQAGDRNPEGFWFRAFLKTAAGRSVLTSGTFHVEMYVRRKKPDGTLEREMVSDWHYGTDVVGTIDRPGTLGPGYALHLRWARKDIAGKEIEIITAFEDEYGRRARSETKRLRVPNYGT